MVERNNDTVGEKYNNGYVYDQIMIGNMYSGILQSLEKDILITMEENPFILAIVLVYAQAAQ